MARTSKKSLGILIQGATGDFYVLASDKPRKIRKNSELDEVLRKRFKARPGNHIVIDDLAQDILDLLEAAFGPLGVWHIRSRQ